MTALDLLNHYYSIRLGVSLTDLRPGEVAVATCDRRTYAELSYGFVSVLWVMNLGERAAISVHPAALPQVARLAWGMKPEDVLGDGFCETACDALRAALDVSDLRAGEEDICLYHPGNVVAVAAEGRILAVSASDKEAWVGARQFGHAAEHPSAQRGEAFGLFRGDELIADVITHDPAVAEMAHLVAADGIEVSERFQRRGYGRALLSYWTGEMQRRGRVCVHSASAANEASVALARSVGYVDYARSRFVTSRARH
jgi:ribosomal protein S18 acetylase RimI-like enzyme